MDLTGLENALNNGNSKNRLDLLKNSTDHDLEIVGNSNKWFGVS